MKLPVQALLIALAVSSVAQPSLAQAQRQTSITPPSVAYRAFLPATQMDSFVQEAGAHANHIYGDEGTDGPPPYMGFNKPHRINTGILDKRDQGITTGHGSIMPDAWGRDEFLGLETDRSGARGLTSAQGFPFGEPEYLPSGSGGGGGGGGTPNPYGVPESPGPGYAPMTQHGILVGWYSPEEVELAQTDFRAALLSIINSDRYYGGQTGADSIRCELGDQAACGRIYGYLLGR